MLVSQNDRFLISGKESDEEIQGILKRFTQSETAKGLSSVEEDSTATSQEDQNTDAKIEEKEEEDLQGNEDKREEEMAPVTRPQGTPKKNKKKKTKNKKGNEMELFGDKGISQSELHKCFEVKSMISTKRKDLSEFTFVSCSKRLEI